MKWTNWSVCPGMYVNTERNLLTENLDEWEGVLLEEYRSGNNITEVGNILEVGEHDIQCTLNKQEVLDYIGKHQWKSATMQHHIHYGARHL